MARKGSSKRPRFNPPPAPTKRARISHEPDEGAGKRIAWRLGDADLGGRFSWDAISDADLGAVHKVLREVDKFHWEAICGDGVGHIRSIPVGNLSTEANQRLREIQRDDEDWLHEITIAGRPRLWGIRRDNVFHVLWWDPEHQVCPSALRNT